MYDYIVTKPPIDDALMHYGIKGMKWRKHLANLKSKASLLKTKVNRKLRGMSADQISYNSGKNTFMRYDDGKASSTSNAQGNKKVKNPLLNKKVSETNNKGYSTDSQYENGRLRNGYPDDAVNQNYAYRDGKLVYVKKLKKK